MSLNKFTDSSVKKDWMNINCNDLKTTSSSNEGTSETKRILIQNDTTLSAVYLQMRNDEFPVNQRTYGYYSGAGLQDVWFARFNDAGGANLNYICYRASGDVVISTPVTMNNDLDLTSNELLNVGPGTTAGGFYEVFTSSGNQYSGIWAAPQAVEYKATRVGNIVSIRLGDVLAVANSSALIAGSVPLPASMRPNIAGQVSLPIRTVDNGTVNIGYFIINTATGAILISSDPSSGPYSGAGPGNSGFANTGVSYAL